jgi:mannose-6-phosphate isomerase-like protein (cupin superfamily)
MRLYPAVMTGPQHYRFAAAGLTAEIAHDGQGQIRAARVHAREPFMGATWVDLVEVPPGHSIGQHRHSTEDEEIYVVISGTATMHVEDVHIVVEPGDVVVNPPGGSHGLVNTGEEPVRLVVVDTAVRAG